MFVPDYSITTEILKNIGLIEYSKAIIENTTILPTWEKQLIKDFRIKEYQAQAGLIGISLNSEQLKKYVDGIKTEIPLEIENFSETYELAHEIGKKREIGEIEIKYLHKQLTKDIYPKTLQGIYRSKKIPDKPDPDEILARMSEVFDWYNSLDAKETHPVITSAIIRGVFEMIQPFEKLNDLTGDIASFVTLIISGYELKGYVSQSDYYYKNQNEFEQNLSTLLDREPDFTNWIDFYTQAMTFESSNVKEKVLLLEKDTKVAKASGRVRLSDRQEKIVAYLQDYGLIQNQDFPKLFPSLSEDTVLRELKKLINKKIVVKKGSTKSSRYELS